MLFTIASCLWIAVIWFINELKQIKLQTNEELGTVEKIEGEPETQSSTTTSTIEEKTNVKQRKSRKA